MHIQREILENQAEEKAGTEELPGSKAAIITSQSDQDPVSGMQEQQALFMPRPNCIQVTVRERESSRCTLSHMFPDA